VKEEKGRRLQTSPELVGKAMNQRQESEMEKVSLEEMQAMMAGTRNSPV